MSYSFPPNPHATSTFISNSTQRWFLLPKQNNASVEYTVAFSSLLGFAEMAQEFRHGSSPTPPPGMVKRIFTAPLATQNISSYAPLHWAPWPLCSSSAFLQEELQLMGNIPRYHGLTRSLVAQCSATSFWPELQWILGH